MENGEFDISSVVGKLMSDPKVAELIKGLKDGVPAASEASSAVEEKAQTSGNVSEIYEKLPEIINTLSPLMREGGKGRTSADAEKRNRLLAALKPYLSSNRQGMIDSIMSYSKLSGLLDLFPDKK